jgi:hypothetical protein
MIRTILNHATKTVAFEFVDYVLNAQQSILTFP